MRQARFAVGYGSGLSNWNGLTKGEPVLVQRCAEREMAAFDKLSNDRTLKHNWSYYVKADNKGLNFLGYLRQGAKTKRRLQGRAG